MKNTKKTANKLPVPGKVRKGVRFYCAAVLSVALVLVFSVNNLHIYDNLLLFTFEIENKSKLPYDIDYIRYYIIDKKTAKLTASQEVDQQALFSENYSPRIEGNGRMKYVIAFDKFTIPDEKVFRIEINEKNGGRHVLFDLENSDIVNVEDI